MTLPSEPAATRRRNPLPRLVLLIILSIAVPLVVLEFGLRVWFGVFGTEADRVAYTYTWPQIAATMRFRGVPYANYGLSPSYPGVNALGYRGEPVTVPKPDGVFRIVTLGGSTTYGDLISDPQLAYPGQLARVLQEDYGYTQIEVVNGGISANASAEIFANFAFRALDLQPDLVIVYDAVNDLAARAIDPAYYAGIPGNAGIWRTDAPDLGFSTLQRYLAINLNLMSNPANQEYRFQLYNPDAQCCAQFTDEQIAANFAANPPIYFERNLRSLAAVAEANDVAVLFVSWTYYPQETIPNFNRLAQPYRQAAVAEHNAVMAEVARTTDTHFFDFYAAMPTERRYWYDDGVHMTPEGTAQQAQLIADYLVENGLLPTP